MVTISDIKEKTLSYLEKNCRKLEVEILKYNFFNGKEENIIKELLKYQNEDGGFGNSLESDFRMPFSSPIATTMALRILEDLNNHYDEIIKKAVNYLENTYIKERNGWFAASKKINNYPRAVWWNFDEKKGGVQIDLNWGNPTTEIIGYLFKYKKYLNIIDINSLVEKAISYINNLKSEDSEEHEIYCFLNFYDLINTENKKRIKKSLEKLVKEKIILNKDEWKNYVPQPINFISNKNSFLYSKYKESFYENLEFLISFITEDYVWIPTWQWYQFDDEWKKAKLEWTGVLTINYLKLLNDFNLIK